MNEGRFAQEVVAKFPDAIVSIDDGESLRFHTRGFDCGSRFLATGKWGVEVRDLRNATFEEADFDPRLMRYDDVEDPKAVVAVCERLLNDLLAGNQRP
jgi:hypothetical protein